MFHPPARGAGDPGLYEIRLRGQLDQRWSEWFEGFTLTNQSDGTTTLTGAVVDQAALHGLLRRVGDLGVTLISLNMTNETKEAPRVQTNE
ncbi:hypothetical protein ACPW96_18010 [Micromonospora sp. DT81.3]|uniref:hypothetical protein n=1 Tax=Micromonospora sp. DT81.3 TaxID=3416523 RepID=UPI003CEF401D